MVWAKLGSVLNLTVHSYNIPFFIISIFWNTLLEFKLKQEKNSLALKLFFGLTDLELQPLDPALG